MSDNDRFTGQGCFEGGSDAPEPVRKAHLCGWLAVASALWLLVGMCVAASATNFQTAASVQLNTICNNAQDNAISGSQLQQTVCPQVLIQGGNGQAAGFGAISSPTITAALEERLRALREAKREGSKPGASSDTATATLAEGLNLFLTVGNESLSHTKNNFEAGYDSTVPTVTLGGDSQVFEYLTLGLAFNYHYQTGSYDNDSVVPLSPTSTGQFLPPSGSFHNNSYGPLLYATFLPFEAAFANVTLGYARQNYSRTRQAQVLETNDGPAIPGLGGLISSDYAANQLSVGALTGYDFYLGSWTIGPRLGLNFAQWYIDNYTEKGNTGLELSYTGLDQTSLPLSLGAFVATAFSTRYGVFQPQLTVAWMHEFLNDDRSISASYVQATGVGASPFQFQRESPARNWATINLGVSAVLANGLQPFANFLTLQGNDRFVSYGGSIGLRFSL